MSRSEWDERRQTAQQPEGCWHEAVPTSTFRLNQRTARTQSGSAFSASTTDAFTYNSKGELILSENDTLTAQEFGYNYDGIGNRISAYAGSATPISYTVNSVNQYVEIEQSPNPALEPTYDSDGNQITDGKGHTLVWDGENRLVEFFPASPDAGDKRVVNTYDGQSRRVKKQVYEWSSGWQLAKDEVFVYDGWNPVMIYDVQISSFSPQLSLTWGRDLSASLEGAGGVGGLLATHDGTTQGIMFYDANGNIGQVMEGSTIIAHYEYDPFGNTINATGTYADDNEFRFSTKFQDEENELYYYGYRFYNPETGRWINRDPIEERGGLNLYWFVGNNPISLIDLLGLTEIRIEVIRTEDNDKEVIGSFRVIVGNEQKPRLSGKTIEPARGKYDLGEGAGKKTYPIPAGKYEVFVRTSDKTGHEDHNKRVFELSDVDGFTHIQIHVGNWYGATEGCLLPGKVIVEGRFYPDPEDEDVYEKANIFKPGESERTLGELLKIYDSVVATDKKSGEETSVVINITEKK